MEISIGNLYIKKPSPFFFITLIIAILFWFILGNPTWRHVDDYGPLKELFDADSLKDYLRLSIVGWGAYPPIWEYFTFLSYIYE